MKKNYYLTYLLLFLIFSFSASAQNNCSAHAGKDLIFCSQDKYLGTRLGGNPTATGTPPFTYKWESRVDVFHIKWASDMLVDTTVANPEVKLLYHHINPFYLTVTDANGEVCKDTMIIRVSSYVGNTALHQYTILQGDSVLLDRGTNIGSPFKPVKYVWIPNEGLTDSTSLVFYAKPKVTTTYRAKITDSLGCVAVGPPYYHIRVSTTGVNEHLVNKVNMSVYPNPAKEYISLLITSERTELFYIEFFDSSGRLIFQKEVKNKFLQLKTLEFPAGTIIYKVINKNQEMVGEGKFVVER